MNDEKIAIRMIFTVVISDDGSYFSIDDSVSSSVSVKNPISFSVLSPIVGSTSMKSDSSFPA